MSTPKSQGEEMNQQLIYELNLALIPEIELANRLISFSSQMARRYPSVIRLSGVTPQVAFAPHVTPHSGGGPGSRTA
jgi:hypothetical protein